MKKLLQTMVFSTSLLFASLSSAASMIFFDSTPEYGSVGDVISVDLMWDGSDDPTYISAWDVDISWDSSILSYSSTTFHFGVDSFGCFPGLTCDAFELAPGLLDVFEVSFDSTPDLMANQDLLGNMFALATFEFTAISDGITPLEFSQSFITFGDSPGTEINPTLRNGLVCIGNPDCITVPEPSTLPLLLIVMVSLFSLRIKRRRKL